MPSDTLRLNKMIFHAYHGYWEEERQVGQRFEVDVELHIDVAQAAGSDNIRDTVDLYKVYQTVERVVTKNTFKLVETLTHAIADTLLQEFHLPQVRVRVRKPNSPVPGISDGIEVEIHRERAAQG
ncbi:dihydroneopterin aldolase [bacterium]|nr:MAG: dihydroneopterin aldolase [candidate division KSB1 bacterium]MBC6950840.1 dihydroneopterin aldolase [candidate division KSB1 bacterium]MCE7944760.1 dihydroneopterin aldolase [Chlorobi bacterium CHB1]MCL4705945.1 dihydroneopterin aldolase [bacterium]NUM75237.1 dihydroneopterin aldolase [candidate division KSB1 bacterium]